MRVRELGLILAITTCELCAAQPNHLPMLNLIYLHRPPLSFTDEEQQASGILPDMMIKAASQANIKTNFIFDGHWVSILSILKRPASTCVIGAYYTEERAEHYRYSQPLFQESTYVVVTRNELASELTAFSSVKDLIGSSYTMGMQQAYSYGPYIDELVQHLQPKIVSVKSGNQPDTDNESGRHIFDLIARKRMDYYFSGQAEYKWMRNHRQDLASSLTALKFNDLDEGQMRYLMCSTGIHPELLSQLNQSIDQLRASDAYQQILHKYASQDVASSH